MSAMNQAGRGDSALPRCEQLTAARGTALAGRFHVWKGRSGRRYIVSAYEPQSVPDYAEAVFMAVANLPDGQRLLACAAREGGDDGWMRAAFAGADEIHLHLLAPDAAGRAAVVADLAGSGWDC